MFHREVASTFSPLQSEKIRSTAGLQAVSCSATLLQFRHLIEKQGEEYWAALQTSLLRRDQQVSPSTRHWISSRLQARRTATRPVTCSLSSLVLAMPV